ncbi:hypothetical protein OBBRIDRAFT_794377 [Obba rivulosa]|uniref:Uncharacterized protein n=1 Tax=Obba rivulosa TaxID=1052685 RepID=A0A8E2AWD6_9APHY|nr:hypothetical protein OBBRIDRAFT_794377 [Obba rivulosa]
MASPEGFSSLTSIRVGGWWMSLSAAQGLADFLDLEVGPPSSQWYEKRLEQAIENHVYVFAEEGVEFKPMTLSHPESRQLGIMFITQHADSTQGASGTSPEETSDDASDDRKAKLWLLERGVREDQLEWVTMVTDMPGSRCKAQYNDMEYVDTDPGQILREAEAELARMEEEYGESISALER